MRVNKVNTHRSCTDENQSAFTKARKLTATRMKYDTLLYCRETETHMFWIVSIPRVYALWFQSNIDWKDAKKKKKNQWDSDCINLTFDSHRNIVA